MQAYGVRAEHAVLVQVALEGTKSNGDCAVPGGLRSVKRYFIKYYAKDDEKNDFADRVVAKVLANQQMYKSMESVFYQAYKQVISTKWWTQQEATMIFLGHNFLVTTQPSRKCVWDGRLELRSVSFADVVADGDAVKKSVATKVPFVQSYADYIDQLRRDNNAEETLPTMFDITKNSVLRWRQDAVSGGWRIQRHLLPEAVVVASPAYHDQPKSPCFALWAKSRHIMYRVWGRLEAASLWGWTRERAWQHVGEADENEVAKYSEFLQSGMAQGRPVTEVYPWLEEDVWTIQYHLHEGGDGELPSDATQSDGDEDEGEDAIGDPVRMRLEAAAAGSADQDAEDLRGFDEAQAREFDWVAHTKATYTAEQVERWRTHVFSEKGMADDLVVAPGVSFSAWLSARYGRAVALIELRPTQHPFVCWVLTASRHFLLTGTVWTVEFPYVHGILANLNGTAGSGKTVCYHTLCFMLGNMASQFRVPEPHLYAMTVAPTGCAAVVAGGRLCMLQLAFRRVGGLWHRRSLVGLF